MRHFALKDEGGISTELWPGAELHRPGDEDETRRARPPPREVGPGDKIQIDMTWDDKMPTVVELATRDRST